MNTYIKLLLLDLEVIRKDQLGCNIGNSHSVVIEVNNTNHPYDEREGGGLLYIV